MNFTFEVYSAPLGTVHWPHPRGQRPGVCVCRIGKGICTLPGENEVYSLSPGDIAVTSALPVFPDSPDFQADAVLFQGQLWEDFARQMESPLIYRSETIPGMEMLFNQLLGFESLALSESSALSYTLLCRLASAPQTTQSLPPLVAGAVSQMQEHYAEVYGIEELADTLMVSKSHLIRSFTAAMGISPGQYLTGVRLENARRLLLRDEYTLEVIANLCGFSCANYLCKVFKKETGETPVAWRKRVAPGTPPPASEWEAQLYL